jgi:hypothetical protein
MSKPDEIKEAMKKYMDAKLTLFNARIDAVRGGDPKSLEEVAVLKDQTVETVNDIAQCGCNMVSGCGGSLK